MLSDFIGALLKWAIGFLTGWQQRRKLASETARADTAEAQVAQDDHAIAGARIQQEAQQAARALPDAPAQEVGKAKPGTAAAELQKGTW